MLKKTLLCLLLLHTTTHTDCTITMWQNEDKTLTIYKHGEFDMGAWYYEAGYDEKTDSYCMYNGALAVFDPLDRRSNPISCGLEGSNAAQCYASLKIRHEEQEAAQQQPISENPSTRRPPFLSFRAWCAHYLSNLNK